MKNECEYNLTYYIIDACTAVDAKGRYTTFKICMISELRGRQTRMQDCTKNGREAT